MKKLEITYEITGFDRVLYDKSPSWKNCIFKMDEKNRANLCIWEENINDQNHLELAEKILKEKVRAFVLAMEFQFMLPLTCRMISIEKPTIAIGNTVYCYDTVILSSETEAICHPSDPPSEIPRLPIECEKWVITLAETHIFGNFVEEQLKREYLIIEELWDEFKNEFSVPDQRMADNLKFIRNFVSHAVCGKQKTAEFICNDSNCPATAISISQQTGKPVVKFLRNDINHRNYIALYEVKARDIARRLVEKKIAKI